ncbi:MAG: hypothetical protein Q8O38_00035 [Sulfurimicrobium sp.]|nr:hypothetical protein [Sulfurimicrobium sp.]
MDISDIMIHIDQALSEEDKRALEEKMRAIPGVIAPRFNAGRDHLLLVAFDPERVKTAAMLDSVRADGYQAQLIGA